MIIRVTLPFVSSPSACQGKATVSIPAGTLLMLRHCGIPAELLT